MIASVRVNGQPSFINGQLLLSDGTAVAPGMAFRTFPTTGLYAPALGELSLAVSGTELLTFSSFGLNMGGRGGLRNTIPSATSPTLLPNISGSETTGWGGAANTLSGIIAGAEAVRIDGSTTATQTRFMLYDVDNAALERVTVGIADSGGLGFKLLRIPN